MHNGQWIMDNVQWIMDNVQCTMYNGQWIMYNGQRPIVVVVFYFSLNKSFILRGPFLELKIRRV
jgi:hypothetical protein